MILLYISLYAISVAILVYDKELEDLRERTPSEKLLFAYAIVGFTLFPIPYYLYCRFVDLYNWMRIGFTVWIVKRKINRLLKSKGIKERL